jgi:tetratricopeptide (TPR) repeat protein
MKKLFILFWALVLLTSAAYAESVADLIRRADVLYGSRENTASCEASLGIYESILDPDAANYEAAWKAAQACKWLGDVYPTGDEKLAVLSKGEKFARKAIETAPNREEGHYWLGVCLGRIGEERGILNSLFMVGPIRDEMEKVLAINPKNDEANCVLSILDRKAPGWPISSGDMDKAKEYALRSIELRPDRIANHIALAEVLMEKGDNAKAKESLLKALELPLEPGNEPENRKDRLKAAELLKKLNERLGIK